MDALCTTGSNLECWSSLTAGSPKLKQDGLKVTDLGFRFSLVSEFGFQRLPSPKYCVLFLEADHVSPRCFRHVWGHSLVNTYLSILCERFVMKLR